MTPRSRVRLIAVGLLSLALSAAAVPAAERRVKLTNHALNRHIRMLDGQWQGTFLASDGNVYVGGGSHNPKLGAAFFRYEPKTGKLKMLVKNITPVCGEDQSKTPPQGKLHSPIVEHDGWIYLGTHLANYTPEGQKAYTGAHLLGYHLATGRFRDFGVIHRNFTNYAALGLDARRRKIYFYVTPFHEGVGSRLYRVDIATGRKQDLGLVARWKNRRDHGPPAFHCFVDAQGDCWLTTRYERTLYVARAATGKIEAHADALPEAVLTYASRDPWRGLRALDENRALVHMAGRMWIFDSRKAPRGKGTFTPIRDGIDPTGLVECFAYGGGRFYWTYRGKDRKAPLHLMSASVKEPAKAIDHGEIVDGGRRPMWAGDLITDGRGTVYMVGRWFVTDEDMKVFGMVRHKMKMAVFFSVMDVSEDLRND
ncbi:MAG TPA: hypothetical protein VM031_06910 [Phycisphaerae bacterium]|nr:hypothetical protein [Phycisphaerae bacterium]